MYIVNLFDEPRLYLVHEFLTPEECDHLISKSMGRLTPATTISNEDGAGLVTVESRNSDVLFFADREDDVISNIEDKLDHLVGFPHENGEQLQMNKYDVGEFYRPHYDFYDPNCQGGLNHIKMHTQRMVTVLMYLNDVEEGGDTEFPELSIKVTPKKGMAVVWWNCFTNQVVDHRTKHGACPVVKGVKYSMTKWYHHGKYFQ